MEYLSSMPFPNKVYFSQNDLKVFGLLNQKTIDHKVTTVQFIFFKKVIWHNPKSSAWNFLIQHFHSPF